MALSLCIIAAIILLAGFGGILPASLSSGGIIVLVLFLAGSAIFLSADHRFKRYIRIVSGAVILTCFALFVKSIYLTKIAREASLNHSRSHAE